MAYKKQKPPKDFNKLSDYDQKFIKDQEILNRFSDNLVKQVLDKNGNLDISKFGNAVLKANKLGKKIEKQVEKEWK